MTIQKVFNALYAVTFLVLLVQGAVVLLFVNSLGEVYISQENRLASYMLADELRQTSDDLTRFARSYVLTGEARYEEYYWQVLDIRNGNAPRPLCYNQIYWDLVVAGNIPCSDGPAVSLQDLMKQAGFSEAEFAKLNQSQQYSDNLVKTEVIAMNAVKGLFTGDSGDFSVHGEPDWEMGRQLMFDEAYNQEKAKIMDPLDDFMMLLDQRTAQTVHQNIQRNNIFLVLMILVAFVLSQARPRSPRSRMQEYPANRHSSSLGRFS
jgi:methyl-accepting chemotaxis protein